MFKLKNQKKTQFHTQYIASPLDKSVFLALN